VTRVFDAPCRQFQAQMAHQEPERWLGPNGHTLLSWEVDFRPGGAARLCVRSAEGDDQWIEGAYLEIVEPERVVFTGELGFADGAVTFRRA
jgi:uncharacterized protein YndB with AHSA1/START domain